MSRSNITLPSPAKGSTGERISEFAEDAKNELAKSMNGLVLAAHEIAANIDSVAGNPAGELARGAAGLLDSFQRSLENHSVAEILEEGEALVRRNPAASLGIAVASGFVIARLLRGSPEE